MRLILTFAFACVVASAAAAQGLPPPPPPPPPPSARPADDLSGKPLQVGTGLILGRVVEAGTMTGVPDAMVTLTGTPLGVAIQRFTNGLSGGPRLTVADSSGRFLFRDLPAGNYQITASAQGFSAAGYQQAKPNQVRRSLDLPRPVELADGEKRGDVVINLWRHSGITGVVMDEAGEPVVGVTVSVLTRTLVSGQPVMQNYATATTDDRGLYWAEAVPGNYVVGLLTAPTTVPNALLDEWAQIRTEGSDGVAAFVSRLSASGMTLPAVAGARIGQLTVTQPRTGWVAPPLVTTAGRLYAYPTTFHPAALSAATAAIVTVGSGEEKPGVNIQVTPRPLLRVSGRVVGPDGPMSNVAVRMVTIDPATTMSSPPSQIDEAVSMTSGDGQFLFPAVAPGAYRLRVLVTPPPRISIVTAEGVSNAPNRPDEPTWWALQNVTVGDDDINGLDLRLARGATFAGKIVFEGTPVQADIDALRNVTVQPRAVPGTSGSIVLAVGSGRGTPAGEFSSNQFVPGPYILEPLNLPRGWSVKSVMVGAHDAADLPVELPESGLNNIVVTLTDKPSRVLGSVRGQNEKAPVAPIVGVFPVDRAMWRRVGMQSRRTQTAIPTRSGLYSINGLPPGEYYIVATEGEVPDLSDPAVLTSLIPMALRISINAGEAKMADLRSVVRK